MDKPDFPLDSIAILVDFENIWISLENNFLSIPTYEELANKLKELAEKKGKVTVAKVYSDWTKRSQIPRFFQRQGFDCQLVMSKETGKDRCDSQIIMDIMDLLYQGDIDRFIICSGDSSFVPVVRRIKARNKDVMIVAVGKTAARELVNQYGITPLESQFELKPIAEFFGFEKVAPQVSLDFSGLIGQLDKLETSLPFVGLKYFRDNFITPSMCGSDTRKAKESFLNEVISRDIIEVYHVKNPNNPTYKTAACKLNRKNPFVKIILEGKKK